MSSTGVSSSDVEVDVSPSVTRSVPGTTVVSNSREEDDDFDDFEDTPGPDRCELEGFTPCSKSHLWKLMMSFYERKGPESWSQGIVPHFITCNAFIGRAYAKVLHGFIKDCLGPGNKIPLDVNETLYIIELGTGSGKFSFYMLKALEEMRNVCDFPLNKIVYVMTDFTETNFDYWATHPSLKKYFDNGTLEAGIFDAVNDSTITLRSGKVLGPGSCKNPICVVANYLFDTLYHDIFQVENGELKEGLVSTGSKNKEEPDPLDPEIIKRLSNKYQYNPVETNYYQDEDGDEVHLERILQWYKDCFGDNTQGASIVFPVGALRALRRLSTFSDNKTIVISGDKGNNNPEQFVGLMDPHIAVHGSFSLMVNYHAVGAWFTSRGGFALHNPQEEASLKVGCFVLDGTSTEDALADSDWLKRPESKAPTETPYEFNGVVGPGEGQGPNLKVEPNIKAYRGSSTTVSVDMVDNLAAKDDERSNAYPFLKEAFENAINVFGPNDFFVLQKTLKEDSPNPPLKSVVSLLKLGDWDPDVFFKFRDAMLNQISNCGQKLRNDICRGIPRVWENYYMLDLDKDIAFEIGRFFYGIRDYTNALHFYVESTSTIGEHHVTYHNQGLCHYSRGYLEVALAHFEKAVSLNEDYEKARNWIEKVKKEMAEKAAATSNDASTEGGETEKAAKEMVENVMSNMSLASDMELPPPPAGGATLGSSN